MTMKRVLVGGPLLGERHVRKVEEDEIEEEDDATPATSDADTDTDSDDDSVTPGKRKTFDPLVTPLIGLFRNDSSSTSRPERFVLLPHGRFVQVLAHKTGKVVANFIPFPSKTTDVNIESVCLVTYPAKPHNVLDVLGTLPAHDEAEEATVNEGKTPEEEFEDHAMVVGCSDGTIREFSLLVLLPTFLKLQREFTTSNDCGSFELTGPTYGPRRVFSVAPGKILSHITAPACVSRADNGVLLYALTQAESKDEENTSVSLFRLLLPPYYNNSLVKDKGVINLAKIGEPGRVHKLGKFHSDQTNLPFSLESMIRDRSQDLSNPNSGFFLQQTVYLVIARPNCLLVYGERLSDIGLNKVANGKKMPSVSFGFEDSNPLSAMSISINKSDVACGFSQGDIVIKTNLLALVDEYHIASDKYKKQTDSITNTKGKKVATGGMKKPDHPSKHVIDASVHWHAHPVASLCYDLNSPPSDPILYSGGDESVLVSWQLSRGIGRPSDMLPRLAQRGISHILCPLRAESTNYNANDSILVYCEDNSLQMFEAHSKGLLWKVLGVAAVTGSEISTVTCDPRSAASASPQLILNALPDAPGVMQWYDTRQQQVVGKLEVAPYNRVSSMDQKEMHPMPAPSVTHFAMTDSGDDLVTIDNVPTENRHVGNKGRIYDDDDDEKAFGMVTSIKFWAWNGTRSKAAGSTKPYDVVAAMANPHGAGNTVSALALSTTGEFACTVSADEKAFRLWQKIEAGRGEGEDASGRRLPVWICQYKVSTPSGYANHDTARKAIAFSADSSILAICFGHMITLWDRYNMTLLTCLNHLNGEDAVASIKFIRHDLLLCTSPCGVSLLTPFKQNQREVGWKWSTRNLPDEIVSCAEMFPTRDVVAVSIYNEVSDSSRLVLFNAEGGEPVRKDDDEVAIETVSGMVCSIGQPGRNVEKIESNWQDENATEADDKEAPLIFHVLNSGGVLVSLREESTAPDRSVDVLAMTGASAGSVPRLPSARPSTNTDPTRKRRRMTGTTSAVHDQNQNKKLAMSSFGSILEESGNAVPLPTSELPTLSGDFARAFVGRNLLRR